MIASAHRLMAYAGQGRWLTIANRYREDTIRRLGDDDGKGSVRARNLCDYIAASAPLHCCDGWALLGRALGCHMRGDADVARHLAYYAELRGAMSLLATQGVGVFSKKHFIVRADGAVEKITESGTHAAAWELLKTWAGLPQAGVVLGKILEPAGVQIEEWVAALPQGAAWQPIATKWLKDIGLDLELFSKPDHDARNEASYRPNHLRKSARLASAQAAIAATEMWALLEPTRALSFGQLDKYLLRRTLESAFASVRGASARRAPVDYRRQVEAASGTVVSASEAAEWTRFLCREQDPQDPEILRMADYEPRPARSDYHVSMMARALMLLRVASGANRRMLKEAGVPLESLSFWWQPYGQGLGLWDDPPAVAELTDGWDDTQSSLEGIEAALKDGGADSYRGVISGLSAGLARLTGMEIVGVWSLAA